MFPRYPYMFLLRNVRHVSTTVDLQAKSHYDALGITPKATHAEIKSAYYKLSKMYHPDKNQDSPDAVTKFRDITSAYEVLGNVRLRKLYDKGVFVGGETIYRHPSDDDDDPTTRFYRSRERRSKPPNPTGRTPIYDFDEWSRAHYGATFARDMARKRREAYMRHMETQNVHDARVEKILYAFLGFVCLYMLLLRDSYDVDRVYQTNKSNKPKTE